MGRYVESDSTYRPIGAEVRLGEEFGLGLVELLGGDRALFFQVVQLVQFVGGGAVGLRLHVFVEMLFRVGLGFDRAVAHTAAAGDQVDQGGQERDEDEEQDPGGLRPSGKLVV